MIEWRVLIHILLIACIIGIILTIATDQWHEGRRWKIGVALLIIAYAAVTMLR